MPNIFINHNFISIYVLSALVLQFILLYFIHFTCVFSCLNFNVDLHVAVIFLFVLLPMFSLVVVSVFLFYCRFLGIAVSLFVSFCLAFFSYHLFICDVLIFPSYSWDCPYYSRLPFLPFLFAVVSLYCRLAFGVVCVSYRFLVLSFIFTLVCLLVSALICRVFWHCGLPFLLFLGLLWFCR